MWKGVEGKLSYDSWWITEKLKFTLDFIRFIQVHSLIIWILRKVLISDVNNEEDNKAWFFMWEKLFCFISKWYLDRQKHSDQLADADINKWF